MSSCQITGLLIAGVILGLGGVFSNSFIITVIINEWTKCRRLASNDLLILSLSLSNFSLTIIHISWYIYTLQTAVIEKWFLFPTLACFIFIVMMSRLWFTAWLCIFYCVKIVDSTHPLFVRCKLRISWLIPRLLVGSLVFCIFISLFSFMSVSTPAQMNITVNVTHAVKGKILKHFIGPWEIIFLTLGSGCPLFVVLLCSILVLASLCKHVWRMTDKESSSRSFQTEGLIKAAKTVVSLLFLYVSYYVAHTLYMFVPLTKTKQILLVMVMTVYAPAQASILLWVNSKLKHAAAQILRRTSH